ncbi:fibronectin type III domain-containing protein [Corynebacterium glucuronolyticum]|uniref:fibronectin type III domain-containing protein n=1 Tax=Corynebacterium glucuronolyticum TaxID=39791 RepID=UPI0021AF4F9F|nr:fibronectin type III domain-containing protein [Corynebacterium glucuronolyticum]MCT1441616.1 fibronectin type III domain-containing protein [Corynebacterium glucuronolyticum]
MRKTALLTAVSLAASLIVAPMAHAGDNGNGFYNVALGPGSDETSVTLTWDQKSGVVTGVDITSDDTADASSTYEGIFTTPNMPSNRSLQTYQHRKAVVRNLVPGKTYTYRIGSNVAGWSEPMTFTAGSGSTSWSFAATGAPNTLVDDATWASTATAATAGHPELLVVTGNATSDMSSHLERDTFTASPALQNVPTAIGIHSGDKGGETGWHFQLPGGLKNHAAFIFNNVGFINVSDTDAAGAATLIRNEAARLKPSTDWLVLYGMSSMSKELRQAVSEAGIDLVLTGGDYYYSRSHLLTADAATKAEDNVLYKKNQGTLFVSLNSASNSNFARPAGASENLAKTSQDGTPDYTTVKVSPEELTITTRDVATGAVIDKVTLSQKDPIKPAPIASETATPTTQNPAPTTTNPTPTKEPAPTTSKKPTPTTAKPTTSKKPTPTTAKPTSTKEPAPTTSKKPTPTTAKPTSTKEPAPTTSKKPTPTTEEQAPTPSLKPGTTVETVIPGNATVLDDTVVDPTGTITGEVLDAAGAKVTGATVSVDKQGKVTVTLPKDAKAGDYTVQLTDGGTNIGDPITITVEKTTPKPKPGNDTDGSSDGSSAENMVWVGVGGFFGMIAVAGLLGWLIGNVLGHARPYLAQAGIYI